MAHTNPPQWGLVNICRLCAYFLDKVQVFLQFLLLNTRIAWDYDRIHCTHDRNKVWRGKKDTIWCASYFDGNLDIKDTNQSTTKNQAHQTWTPSSRSSKLLKLLTSKVVLPPRLLKKIAEEELPRLHVELKNLLVAHRDLSFNYTPNIFHVMFQFWLSRLWLVIGTFVSLRSGLIQVSKGSHSSVSLLPTLVAAGVSLCLYFPFITRYLPRYSNIVKW